MHTLSSWWRHQMETLSILLALCDGNPPVNGWANNRKAGDLRRHRDHYDITIMLLLGLVWVIMIRFVTLSVYRRFSGSIYSHSQGSFSGIVAWVSCDGSDANEILSETWETRNPCTVLEIYYVYWIHLVVFIRVSIFPSFLYLVLSHRAMDDAWTGGILKADGAFSWQSGEVPADNWAKWANGEPNSNLVCSTSLMASLIRSVGGLSKCFYQGLWLAVLSADVIGQSINRRGVA